MRLRISAGDDSAHDCAAGRFIVALSLFLNPFTSHAPDLAGAFVSPLLALLGGWFLWCGRGDEILVSLGNVILYASAPSSFMAQSLAGLIINRC